MTDPKTALQAVGGRSSEGGSTLPNIPAVPTTDNAALNNILASVKLWIEKASDNGVTGFASKQDLVRAGLIKTDAYGNVISSVDLNLSTPPVPTGLSASGAMTSILVQWDNPAGSYSNHAYTEIWSAETDNFTNAVLVGESSGMFFAHAVGEDTTRYYWIRFVSTAGIKGPFNSLGGTLGQTAKNPAYLLSTLTGQLTESQLYSSLTSRINLIDGADTLSGSVNSRIKATNDSLQAQINQLSNTPVYDNTTTYPTGQIVQYSGGLYQAKSSTTGNLPTDTTYWTKIGDYTSLGAAVADNTAQITAINTVTSGSSSAAAQAISSLQSRVTTAEGNITTTAANLTTEATTRASADSALSSSITTLTSTVNGHTTSIQTQQTTIDGLSAKYTVKVDNNGYVSGFGLASTANNGTPTSEFQIVADKFSIAPVATDNTAADGSPFFYLTTPTTINGVSIQAGAYMKAAYIHDASITNAKIANLSADKITAGTLSADRIGANTLTADKINGNNLAVVNGTFSGSLQAATGTFTGSLSAATGTFSGRLTAGTLDPGVFAGRSYSYATPGSYAITVPTDTQWSSISMRFTLQGAGGGGGGVLVQRRPAGAGGGGAGGSITITINNLTPGATYTLVVGTGGKGGYGYANGAAGGSTSIAGYSASGGAGGGGALGGEQSVGIGGGGSIGGESGYAFWEAMGTPVAYGGAGGSSAYGNGAPRNNVSNNYVQGGSNGGVGAGGSGAGSVHNDNLSVRGGDGGPGFAFIEFFDPNSVVTNTRYQNLIAWLNGIGHGAVPDNAR